MVYFEPGFLPSKKTRPSPSYTPSGIEAISASIILFAASKRYSLCASKRSSPYFSIRATRRRSPTVQAPISARMSSCTIGRRMLAKIRSQTSWRSTPRSTTLTAGMRSASCHTSVAFGL